MGAIPPSLPVIRNHKMPVELIRGPRDGEIVEVMQEAKYVSIPIRRDGGWGQGLYEINWATNTALWM